MPQALNGSWGGIYGFGGYARPAILFSSVINVTVFLLVASVLILNDSRYRWLLCATFLVQAFVAAIFFPLRYGL